MTKDTTFRLAAVFRAFFQQYPVKSACPAWYQQESFLTSDSHLQAVLAVLHRLHPCPHTLIAICKRWHR